MNTKIDGRYIFGGIAKDLLTVIRNIAQFDAGANGPFGNGLTAAQRNFLQGEIATAGTAGQTLAPATATNGINQKSVADALERHEAAQVLAQIRQLPLLDYLD